MSIHSEKISPCRCGSTKTPDLDSDDMVPCWTVMCHDCKQIQHGISWTMNGAVNKWNEENSLQSIRDYKIESILDEGR